MAQRKSRPGPVGGERRKRRFEERDQRIREVSTRLFLERGLHGFTVADVAEAIDYSKGTFYQHYTSKEDALMEVLLRTTGPLADVFDRAAAAPVGTRARMSSVIEVNIRGTLAHPEMMLLSMAFFSSGNLEKASAPRQQALSALYARENATMAGLVREALSRGDLQLGAAQNETWPIFALASTSFGSMYLASTGNPARKYTLEQMRPFLLYAYECMLDGVGWKPVGGGDAYRRDVEVVHGILTAEMAKARRAS
jgi:AcrR family transcriptional regulator